MANERQVDIDMSLHQFGQRMRKAWEQRNKEWLDSFHGKVKDTVRDQWELEQKSRENSPGFGQPPGRGLEPGD